MWLAPVIILGIVLVIVGTLTGIGYMAIPALILTALLVVLHFTVLRKKGDDTGRLEKGPAQAAEGRGQAEDTAGGPLDESTGYAHSGQRVMTPEQAERHSAD